MQLTKHTDLGLRVLIYLASSKNSPIKIREIADFYHVSKNHLVKVVHQLVKLGYLTSVQGRGGGVALARKSSDIRVGDVVRDMETTIDLIDCKAANCPLTNHCRLKAALNNAMSNFLGSLNEHSIESLLGNKIKSLQDAYVQSQLRIAANG